MKGVLRYWYRAIQPDLTKEKEIFGNTEKRSSIRLHMDARSSTATSKQHRKSIQPRERFTLNLLLHPEDDKIQRDVFVSLWLMTTIGGLGARCRRGFGTLSIQKIENQYPETAFLFKQVNSIEDWEKQVQAGLRQCWRWYQQKKETVVTHPMVHPTLKMYICKYRSKKWDIALSKGAKVLQEFRKTYEEKEEVLKMIGNAKNGERNPSATWLRVVRINNYFYPVYFVIPNELYELSRSVYEEFVRLWGEWLKKRNFEVSEVNE